MAKEGRKGRSDRLKIQSEYYEGYSCSQLAKMYGVTRQSIHELLTRLNTEFRKNKLLPFVIYDGLKWTISKTTGYYRSTAHRKKHLSLHRYTWEKLNGVIPYGFDIHHKDRNKTNNNIANLELISHSEHAKKYSTGNNQFTKI